MRFFSKKNNSGFVALTSVLLMTAVLLFIVSSVSMQVLDGGETSLAYEHSKKAYYFADACAEYVLTKLSYGHEYDGTDSPLDIDEDDVDDCEFTIYSEPTETGYFKTIKIRSQVGSNLYTAVSEIVAELTVTETEVESDTVTEIQMEIILWNKNAE